MNVASVCTNSQGRIKNAPAEFGAGMGQCQCKPIVKAAAAVVLTAQAWELLKARHEETVRAKDSELRAQLGVDAFGYAEVEDQRKCSKCAALKPQASYSNRQWKLGGFCRACTCSYCHWGIEPQDMTKEHLLPKCFGGTAVVPACRRCNQERGHSGDYKPFRRYILVHPEAWKQALCTATGPFDKLEAWLVENDLLGASLAAIASR